MTEWWQSDGICPARAAASVAEVAGLLRAFGLISCRPRSRAAVSLRGLGCTRRCTRVRALTCRYTAYIIGALGYVCVLFTTAVGALRRRALVPQPPPQLQAAPSDVLQHCPHHGATSMGAGRVSWSRGDATQRCVLVESSPTTSLSSNCLVCLSVGLPGRVSGLNSAEALFSTAGTPTCGFLVAFVVSVRSSSLYICRRSGILPQRMALLVQPVRRRAWDAVGDLRRSVPNVADSVRRHAGEGLLVGGQPSLCLDSVL